MSEDRDCHGHLKLIRGEYAKDGFGWLAVDWYHTTGLICTCARKDDPKVFR